MMSCSGSSKSAAAAEEAAAEAEAAEAAAEAEAAEAAAEAEAEEAEAVLRSRRSAGGCRCTPRGRTWSLHVLEGEHDAVRPGGDGQAGGCKGGPGSLVGRHVEDDGTLIASCTCGQVERHWVPARAESVSDVTALAVVREAVATPFRSNSTARPPSALRSRMAAAPRGTIMLSAFRLATGTGAAEAVVEESGPGSHDDDGGESGLTANPRCSLASNTRALRSRRSRTVRHRVSTDDCR